MNAQKILSLLIVVLSVASILGRPAEQNSSNHSPNDLAKPQVQLQTKYQLLVDTFKNFKEIAIYYVNEALNICKQILKDEELLARSSSAEIEAFKENLTHFMTKYNNHQDVVQLFDFKDIFANTTEFYLKLPNDAISPDAALISGILKKYRFDKLEAEFQQLFSAAIEKFKENFEGYKDDLQEEKAMLEWFERFKALTDAEYQAAALDEFVTFY